MNVAIIIPYYQRDPGILRRSLLSIFAQDIDKKYRISIIIVDDSSPSPVKVEMDNLDLPQNFHIDIIRQANAGPGAARNTGLDAVGDNIDYIAFIDSDDLWLKSHLSRACTALESGFDFYFCNIQEGSSSCFENAGFSLQNIDGCYHALEIDGSKYYKFVLGEAINYIVAYYISHTSTVVYRREPFKDLRFDSRQAFAGEDHIFWASIVQRSDRVCFTDEMLAIREEGFNLYTLGMDLYSERYLNRIIDNLLKKKKLCSIRGLNSAIKSRLNREIAEHRQNILYAIIKRSIKGKIDLRAIRRLSIADDMFWVAAPAIGGRLVGQMVRRRITTML